MIVIHVIELHKEFVNFRQTQERSKMARGRHVHLNPS